jgi:hypothetical protein
MIKITQFTVNYTDIENILIKNKPSPNGKSGVFLK